MIILIGALLGSIVFSFTFIASKKNGAYYLAPIITFLMFIAITAYSLFFIGGFEGMAYGILALGFLFVSIIGTLLLPLLTRKASQRQFNKADKIKLAILPLLFFLTIGSIIYSDKGYWIIDEGITNGEQEGYERSIGMEGRDKISLRLGEDYLGKEITVIKVSRRGPTVITVEITDGGHPEKAPYIQIGLDEVKEPLTIQTTDGDIFESISTN